MNSSTVYKQLVIQLQNEVHMSDYSRFSKVWMYAIRIIVLNHQLIQQTISARSCLGPKWANQAWASSSGLRTLSEFH